MSATVYNVAQITGYEGDLVAHVSHVEELASGIDKLYTTELADATKGKSAGAAAEFSQYVAKTHASNAETATKVRTVTNTAKEGQVSIDQQGVAKVSL